MAVVKSDPVSSRREFWRYLSRRERYGYAAGVAGMALVLFLAWWLSPDPRGYGTHEQLGLPPCSAELLFGLPCPFCGMTTSFSLMAHQRWRDAFLVQPAGAMGFIATCVVMCGCALAALAGRLPAWVLSDAVVKPALFTAGIILTLAWVYKIGISIQ